MFAAGKFGTGFLKLLDPEQVGRELGNVAFEIGVAKFLFIVMERGSKTAFGVFVHLLSADLKLDDMFFRSDDCGMKGLIAVLFGGRNVVFDTAIHGSEKGVDDAESEIARGDVFDYEAEGNEVIDAIDILVVFGKFAVEGIHRFDATTIFKWHVLFFEGLLDGNFGKVKLAIGGFETSLGKILEKFITPGIDVAEADIFKFGADAAHLEAVSERGEDFE